MSAFKLGAAATSTLKAAPDRVCPPQRFAARSRPPLRPRPRRAAAPSLRSRAVFFASLISAPCKLLKARDLVERELGEQAQEAPDIGVFGVAPELPIFVGRQQSRR